MIISGHPEYHDLRERTAFVQLVSRGVSLAILGGNSFGWHARLDHQDQQLSVWRERRLDPHPGPPRPSLGRLGWNPATLTGVHGVHGRPGRLRLEHAASWAWSGVPHARDWGRAGRGVRRALDAPAATARHTTVLASAPIAGGSESVAWTLVEQPRGAFVLQRLRARLLMAARLPVAAVSALDRRTLARRGRSTTIRAAPGCCDRCSAWSRT